MRHFVIAELSSTGEVTENGVVVSEAFLRTMANVSGAMSDKSPNSILDSVDLTLTSLLEQNHSA